MTSRLASQAICLSIGSVERETGLSKDTLRVWERRYGFPQPGRDAAGERAYSAEQLEKLRLIKRLLDRGYRPGKIVPLETAQLRMLADRRGAASSLSHPGQPALRDDLCHYVALCQASEFDQLRRELSRDLGREGVCRFIVETVAPLNILVGQCWESGRLAVFEEHLYTETVHVVLRNAIAAMLHTADPGLVRPRVLLTTFPQEAHGLGLLMAEAVFVLEGARCVSLGVKTPVIEIALAAQSQSADIVALSFSSAMNPTQVLSGLADLRARLPANVEIWAGGRCPVFERRCPSFVRLLELTQIGLSLKEWRARHDAGPT